MFSDNYLQLNREMAEWRDTTAAEDDDDASESVFILEPCSFCGNEDEAKFKVVSFPCQDDRPITYVECECGSQREQLYTYKGPQEESSPSRLDYAEQDKRDSPTAQRGPKVQKSKPRHNYSQVFGNEPTPSLKSENEAGESEDCDEEFVRNAEWEYTNQWESIHEVDEVHSSPSDSDLYEVSGATFSPGFDEDSDKKCMRNAEWENTNQWESIHEVDQVNPSRSDSSLHEDSGATFSSFDEDNASGAALEGPETTTSEENIMANIDEIVNRVLRLPCVHCNGQNFSFIRDATSKDNSILARQCTHCEHLDGVDDTMSIFDIIAQLSRKEYKAAECIICQNDDPEKFVFDEKDGELCLTCMNCTHSTPVGKEAIVHGSDEKGGDSDSGDIMVDDDPDVPFTYIVCESCGNHDNFHVELDIDNNIKYIKCNERRCTNRLVRNFGVQGNDPSKKDSKYPSPRTQIDDLFQLKYGDHLAFHKTGGYWHHGIFIKIHEDRKNRIKVIHYNPEGNVTLKDILLCRGKVKEEWIDVDPSKQEMYRFDYNLNECFSPREVVQRARQRLGESNYNLLTNNCEHLARWCKTGKARSSQVDLFKRFCTTLGKHVVGCFLTSATKIAMTQKLSYKLAQSELDSMVQEFKKAHIQKSLNNISNKEFIKIVVKRGVRGICVTVGTIAIEAVGSRAAEKLFYRAAAQAGSAAIPIPIVGSIVGATLGYLIFSGLGAILGREIAANMDKSSK